MIRVRVKVINTKADWIMNFEWNHKKLGHVFVPLEYTKDQIYNIESTALIDLYGDCSVIYFADIRVTLTIDISHFARTSHDFDRRCNKRAG